MPTFIKKILSDKTLAITTILSVIALLFGQVAWTDINVHTIVALAALLLLVSVYERTGVLVAIATTIIQKSRTTRQVILVTLLLSFFGSMIFTNDVAILTLVPIFVTIARKLELKMVLPVIFITIFANLGSAFTPFGNPQNLYLASHYHLTLGHFLQLSLPIGVINLVFLLLSPFAFKNDPINDIELTATALEKRTVIILVISTLLVLASILNLFPIWGALLVSVITALLLNRQTFGQIDYGVLLMFVEFFVIVGALSRIDWVSDMIKLGMTTPAMTFITGAISSQFISNVPAAVLLSNFTSHDSPLYLGVTTGGLGTLIASLANLLAWRQFAQHTSDQSWHFPLRAMLINGVLLIIYLIIGLLLIMLKLN